MTVGGAAIAASILLISGSAELERVTSQPPQLRAGDEKTVERSPGYPLSMRPGTLADLVDSLAGGPVRLVSARVVGVFDPQVFLVESQTWMRPIVARNRVLVFVES